MYNANDKIYTDILNNEESTDLKFGNSARHVISCTYRLAKLLYLNPSLRNEVVSVSSHINRKLYENIPNYIESQSGRYNTGVILNSNEILKSISVYRKSNKLINTVVAFNNHKFYLNLSAILALLMSLSPVYDTNVLKDKVQSKASKLREAVYGNDNGSSITDLRYLIENDCTCLCGIPEIEKVEFYEGSKNRNTEIISWFEPYNPADKEYHKNSAMKAVDDYEICLSNANNSDFIIPENKNKRLKTKIYSNNYVNDRKSRNRDTSSFRNRK